MFLFNFLHLCADCKIQDKDKKMTIANVTKSFLNTNTHNAFLFLFLLSLGQCYDLETFGISSIFSFEFVLYKNECKSKSVCFWKMLILGTMNLKGESRVCFNDKQHFCLFPVQLSWRHLLSKPKSTMNF